MPTILFINGSPRIDRSHSTEVAEAFIEAYVKQHNSVEIQRLNLFEVSLPEIDEHAVSGRYKMSRGLEHSPKEEQSWKAINSFIDNFIAADLYVFSIPMWNFSVPYKVKQFIDVVTQPGRTFSAGPDGYRGLLTNKQAIVSFASGGKYGPGSPSEAYNYQSPYIDVWLSFIGVTDVASIAVDGTMMDTVEQSKTRALNRARDIAVDF